MILSCCGWYHLQCDDACHVECRPIDLLHRARQFVLAISLPILGSRQVVRAESSPGDFDPAAQPEGVFNRHRAGADWGLTNSKHPVLPTRRTDSQSTGQSALPADRGRDPDHQWNVFTSNLSIIGPTLLSLNLLALTIGLALGALRSAHGSTTTLSWAGFERHLGIVVGP